MTLRLAPAVLALVVGCVGCAELQPPGQRGSVSFGRTNRGRIVDAVVLPNDGDGYVTLPLWQARGHRYATDEMVDLIIAASRRVALASPGPRLAVGDLSPAQGGRSRQHQSHQSGRDVDLLFFMTDEAGAPIETDRMRRFGSAGISIDDRWAKAPRRYFDVARNWQMVKALLTAPEAEVQYVFIYAPLAQLLLDHARALGEPDELVALARSAMMQPGDSAPHDDHMHIRIFCSTSDTAAGCVDRGSRVSLRQGEPAPAPLPSPLQTMVAARMPAMLALIGRP